MPKVGKKEFSYSDKGKAEAKAYAEKTGQNIEKGSSSMAYESNDARNRSQTYKEGGKVKKDKGHKTNLNVNYSYHPDMNASERAEVRRRMDFYERTGKTMEAGEKAGLDKKTTRKVAGKVAGHFSKADEPKGYISKEGFTQKGTDVTDIVRTISKAKKKKKKKK
jgi:hypothetical protein